MNIAYTIEEDDDERKGELTSLLNGVVSDGISVVSETEAYGIDAEAL